MATHWPPQFGAPSTFAAPQAGAFSHSHPSLAHESLAHQAAPHPAVARIVVPEGAATSYGSGTLVDVRDDHGLVITNWHVIRDATGTIEVSFPDGFRSLARVLKVDEDWDLAALAIWRPSASPVSISPRAPQPGEALTICGYGAGNYRSVTGRCTQYYSPRLDLPQQMVELSAEARQGDSGGPIFNQQGELAGVLFGASHGTTMGAYGGRVQEFLTSLAPDIGQSNRDFAVDCPQCIANSPRRNGAPQNSGEYRVVAHQADSHVRDRVGQSASQEAWSSPGAQRPGTSSNREFASYAKTESNDAPRADAGSDSDLVHSNGVARDESAGNPKPDTPHEPGETNFFEAVGERVEPATYVRQDCWYDQARNLLAAIGLVVLSVRLLRILC